MTTSQQEQAKLLAGKAENAKSVCDEKWAVYMEKFRDGNAGMWGDAAVEEWGIAPQTWLDGEKRLGDFVKSCFS